MNSRIRICPDGVIQWGNNEYGFHREGDKPAYVKSNGESWWCKNGDFHRDNNLPAITRANGSEEYWVKGIKVSAPFK